MMPLAQQRHKYPECFTVLPGGFTLLEILLAIFFFGIIITTIFGAYRTILGKAESVQTNMVVNEMAQKCLHRMMLDLQSIYVPQPPLYKRPTLDSLPDAYRIVSAPAAVGSDRFMTLRFTSLAHVVLDRQFHEGVAEIVYYIHESGDDRYELRRSDRLFFDEPFEPQVGDPILCENVKTLTFKFFDHEGAEHDQWDSESDDVDYATPRAVAIQLEIGTPSATFEYETRVNLPAFRDKVGAI
jgi:general secretion pathway protein J